ncbi:MAG: tape measure protein [Paludibacteraceae bacterium]
MANGRLSFSIALNLASQGFKQGAAQVKNALRNIQYQVLGMASALGLGGIGLSNLVSRFIDVARETNRARMALRNISGDSVAFGVNMNYLTNLAQQYGQNLNTLTSNFSRFSAASNAAGVDIKEQQEIYSSVTKAITAFGLSGEEANLTFMALGQMMAKGKISSEELRRQMGERIPTAMQAMANAAGVSIQQLDKMLKNGEIYSKDILPKFAKELDKLTGNINLDNLETSVNRLSTAFIKLTEDLRIGEFYKKLVDGAASALTKVQSLFSTFISMVVGVGLVKLIRGYMTYQSAVVATYIRTEFAARKAQIVQEVAAMNLTRKQQVELTKQRLAVFASYQAQEGYVNKFLLTAKNAYKSIQTALMSIAPMALLMGISALVGRFIELNKKAKETANIFLEYQKGFDAVNGGQEIEKLKQLKKLSDEYKGGKDGINHAQVELMNMLGIQKGKEQQINQVIADRLVMLEATARFDYALQEKMDAETKKREILSKYGGAQEYNKKVIAFNKWQREENALGKTNLNDESQIAFGKLFGVGKGQLLQDSKAIAAYNKVLGESNAQMDLQKSIMLKYASKTTPGSTDVTSPSGGGSGGSGGRSADDAAEAALQALASSLSASSGDLLSPEDVSKLAGIKRYVPTEGVRDTTFDYKKSDLDILEEKKQLLSDYIENLKDKAPHALELIKQKEGELTTLSEALKLQELKDDIKKFKDEIDDLNKDILLKSIDGFVDLTNSIDSIAKSWERVASADMSGWERMVAIINAMGETIKGVSSAWEAYSTIKELIDAKEKASALQKVATATMQASAAGVEAEANIVAGSAKTFNAHAGIPFVGIGIAAAGIAAMIALIAKSRNSIPKYAEGGIIGGTSYTGDKVLGRFNSGEMVITRADQRNLNRAIKSGNFGGGNVEFVIKGKDLVGTLNQQQQRASRR